jgi:2-methylisocitrate lyase-like PEP mutase family enzyme
MSSSRPSIADKRKTFRKLHEAGCFVIPNPWNVGTAHYLQGLGFKALATTTQDTPIHRAAPTARRAATMCSGISASSPRRPTCR